MRAKRLCDLCGGYDDHPRHVQAVLPGTAGAAPDGTFLAALPDGVAATAIGELMDSSTVVRHLDCCAAAGCSSCADVVAQHDGLTGDALTAAITEGS